MSGGECVRGAERESNRQGKAEIVRCGRQDVMMMEPQDSEVYPGVYDGGTSSSWFVAGGSGCRRNGANRRPLS